MHTQALQLFIWRSTKLARKTPLGITLQKTSECVLMCVCVHIQSLAADHFKNSHELKKRAKSDMHSWS